MMFKQSTKSKLFYGKTYHSNLKHATLLVCALLASNLFASAAPFKNDDVICFPGDSITHGGRYPFYILDYYATRFPERKITIHNCGISGDTATGGIKRLQWNVIDHKPTVTTIMFGMNDVRRSLYGRKTPDKNNLAGRKRATDAYKSKMKEINAKLKENNISIIYITPPPYDQTVENKTRNLFGANDALKECAEFCREQAKKNSSGLVELNQPMTAINAKGQKTNPKFSLIGRDRVTRIRLVTR